MRIFVAAKALAVLSFVGAAAMGQEMPEMPQPTAQHEWLQKLVGEWRTTATMTMPDEPPITSKGTATVRPLGGFWVIVEHQGEMAGHAYTGVQTLGYSTKDKEYRGTWVDSMSDHLWEYRGAVDDGQSTLTLRCEGPCPLRPGEETEFKEVFSIKDANHLTFTSTFLAEDGSWTQALHMEFERAK
jgi:hypothetical protein